MTFRNSRIDRRVFFKTETYRRSQIRTSKVGWKGLPTKVRNLNGLDEYLVQLVKERYLEMYTYLYT